MLFFRISAFAIVVGKSNSRTSIKPIVSHAPHSVKQRYWLPQPMLFQYTHMWNTLRTYNKSVYIHYIGDVQKEARVNYTSSILPPLMAGTYIIPRLYYFWVTLCTEVRRKCFWEVQNLFFFNMFIGSAIVFLQGLNLILWNASGNLE